MSHIDKTHARMFDLIFINCKAYDKVVTIISLVYYFIMDGKPTIKIMNRIELLTSLKLTNSESESKSMIKKKFNSKKRGSIPLVSTSISVKKNNNPKPNTLRKFQNNFMTSKTHLNAVTSCKRIFQSHTAMAKPLVKKEDPLQKTECQKLLCKNSDKIQKLLWNEPEENLPPLILSANFIMDEDDFWSAPKINPSINKCWKQIHKNYYVIWIVKSQRNFKKIKQYSDQFQLPLNAAYYHKKQLKYTVDYSPLRRQLIKFYGSELKEIKAIENLKLNTKDLCQFRTFTGKIPIMFDSRLSVYYIRSEESGHGLELVSDICRSSNSIKKRITVQLKSVKNFVEEHYTNLQIEKEQKSKGDLTRASTLEQKLETQWVDQQLTQREVESFKKQLIDQIIREKGRNFQYEGFSVHYFVGDIIKRNYQLLQQSAGRRLEPKFYNNTNKNAKILKMGQNNRDLGIVQRFYQYYA